MKKIIKNLSMLLALVGLNATAQITTQPSEPEPGLPLKVIVDLNQLDNSKDYIQNLIDDADAGLDLYIWTWNPREHGPAHPLNNGSWDASNEALKMTKEAERVYSFTFGPTIVDWYETDANEVYKNDVSFLVKPKDGGGFGNPDRKTDDITLAIDPPFFERNPFFGFPLQLNANDMFVLTYDRAKEDASKTEMKNAPTDNIYIIARCVFSDETSFFAKSIEGRPTNGFTISNNAQDYPDLKMRYAGNDIFKKLIIPSEFFETTPGGRNEGKTIITMDFIVIALPFSGGDTRSNFTVEIDFRCQ